jgi:hypothetical protein
MASSNGQGTTRGVAQLFATLACGGKLDGVRLSQVILDEALTEQWQQTDALGLPCRMSMGFMLATMRWCRTTTIHADSGILVLAEHSPLVIQTPSLVSVSAGIAWRVLVSAIRGPLDSSDDGSALFK